ncbi:MAG: NUDIX hydrolase [Acidimicrobiia bacterium]
MSLAEFTVAGALVESDAGLLLVRNRRRNGSLDWSTPGGVIDATDASVLDGLAREVREETGLEVSSWEGPLYEVRATASEWGWVMRCEVYRAVEFAGEVRLDDPDGIVIEACFATSDEWPTLLDCCSPWVREPLADWLEHRWGPDQPRGYAYDVFGGAHEEVQVVRTAP